MRDMTEIPKRGYAAQAWDTTAWGSGYKTGRRPRRLAVSKADMQEIIAALHERGLGQNVIGYLLGYSPTHISRVMRDLGLIRHNPGTVARAIIAHLPPGLAATVKAVRLKSGIAHERAAVKLGLKEYNRTVHILPED